jgi:putative PIN family toxin of toxin-antitoxin system
VLDTDVLVAALRSSRGASRQLLLGALDHRFELLLSVSLVLEYEAVLTRPEHLAACGLRGEEVERVLDDLASVARLVRLSFRWRPRLSDPNDDMVLETAVNGDADAIVTFNQRDLREASRSGRAGRAYSPPIIDCAVILPGAALQQMRSLNP